MKVTDNLKNISPGLPVWMQMAAKFPFSLLYVYERYRSWLHAGAKKKISSFQTLSVVIPTLNEEKNIVKCIRSISGNRHVLEIIVVDAGSKDQTRLFARKAGARVMIHDCPIENDGGRGGQIKAGINSARGNVVVILHADAILPDAEINRMMKMLNEHPGVIGGSIGCRFNSSKPQFRLIELANDFRAAFLKISFGDQVQFFRRQPVVDHDLFPPIPLMEDVEFSMRLHRLGRQLHLFGNVRVSTRRWENVGFKNARWIFIQVLKYLLTRLWSEPDTANLYKKYYNTEPPKA